MIEGNDLEKLDSHLRNNCCCIVTIQAFKSNTKWKRERKGNFMSETRMLSSIAALSERKYINAHLKVLSREVMIRVLNLYKKNRVKKQFEIFLTSLEDVAKIPA